MIVHFVGAGPGDPELLTLKAARLLRACRICVYAGSVVSPGVLALVPNTAGRRFHSASYCRPKNSGRLMSRLPPIAG